LDYADYVRNSKQTQRTILLSDIVLPPIVEVIARSDLFHCNVLDPSERRQGLDVYRMIRSDIEIINEREKELSDVQGVARECINNWWINSHS
jgi:hypothetical protein